MYEMNNKPEENLNLFAAEYVALHWTENKTNEEEPVMFSISEKVDQSASFDEFLGQLTDREFSMLEQVLQEELKWCEETLSSDSLEESVRAEVKVLKHSYKETIQEMKEWENIMKFTFVGSQNFKCPSLIVGKTYEAISISKDEKGEEWALIKNEFGNEVEYKTKFFEVVGEIQ